MPSPAMIHHQAACCRRRLIVPTVLAVRNVIRHQALPPPPRIARANNSRSFSTTTTNSVSSGRVGFIGLGNMGLPMALNLAKEDDGDDDLDGAPVLAFDVSASHRDAAAAQGRIEIADSTAAIASTEAGCGVIFTMLPGCDAVNDVMETLLKNVGTAASTEKRVIVDCSTVSPTTSRYWHEAWADAGHAMLDAPVSGGVKGATDGTLTFMVGYHHEDGLALARPYLERMGRSVMYCGGPGAGAVTKLCNNLALACQMIGIGEAMNLGDALGVDPVVLADVMNKSTAKCWSCEVNNPHPVVATAHGAHHGTAGPPASRDYEGGFGTRLMLKDLGLAVAVAQDTNVAMPLTTQCKELYKLADLHGLGHKDFGVILQLLKGK